MNLDMKREHDLCPLLESNARVDVPSNLGTAPHPEECRVCAALWEAEASARAEVITGLRTKVEADRADLTTKIGRAGPECDSEQIDQWASERVALNRVLALLDKVATP